MSHANARFTLLGRLLIVERIEAGMPHRRMGLSRGTVAKWWHRWPRGGRGRSGGPVFAAAALSAAHQREA